MKKFVVFITAVFCALLCFACTPTPDPEPNGGVDALREKYVAEMKHNVDMYRGSYYGLDAYEVVEHNLLLDGVYRSYEPKIMAETQESKMQELALAARVDASWVGVYLMERDDGLLTLEFIASEYSIHVRKVPALNPDFYVYVEGEEGIEFTLVSKGYSAYLGDMGWANGPAVLDGGTAVESPDTVAKDDYVGVIVKKEGKIIGYTVSEGMYYPRNHMPRYRSVEFTAGESSTVSEEQVIGFMESFMRGESGSSEPAVKFNAVKRELMDAWALGSVSVTTDPAGEITADFAGLKDGVTIKFDENTAVTVNGESVTGATIVAGDLILVAVEGQKAVGLKAAVYLDGEEVGVFAMVAKNATGGESARLTSSHTLLKPTEELTLDDLNRGIDVWFIAEGV